MVCSEGIRVAKNTWWITLLTNMYTMLLTVYQGDLAKELRVAILEVANGRPNRSKTNRFFCRLVLGTGGKGAEDLTG